MFNPFWGPSRSFTFVSASLRDRDATACGRERDARFPFFDSLFPFLDSDSAQPSRTIRQKAEGRRHHIDAADPFPRPQTEGEKQQPRPTVPSFSLPSSRTQGRFWRTEDRRRKIKTAVGGRPNMVGRRLTGIKTLHPTEATSLPRHIDINWFNRRRRREPGPGPGDPMFEASRERDKYSHFKFFYSGGVNYGNFCAFVYPRNAASTEFRLLASMIVISVGCITLRLARQLSENINVEQLEDEHSLDLLRDFAGQSDSDSDSDICGIFDTISSHTELQDGVSSNVQSGFRANSLRILMSSDDLLPDGSRERGGIHRHNVSNDGTAAVWTSLKRDLDYVL
ncbi:hypothetical protein B0H19DRAFT_1225658 [Mycena capillaripes]|nr:hypothetical protein B0H19DRAFT_1225658 [Mycena capillaripes]